MKIEFKLRAGVVHLIKASLALRKPSILLYMYTAIYVYCYIRIVVSTAEIPAL